jgi:uncharacterized DUF497 family protein
MEFEFDLQKSRSNKIKHGIDFIEARNLWEDPQRVIIPTKYVEEKRNLIIGIVKDKIWSGIYTIRNNKIRIISVRRARKNEEEIYES